MLPATNGQDAHGCTLAMGGGNIYMATFSNSGPTYISGKASEPAAKWTQTRVPLPANMGYRANGHLALTATASRDWST